MKTTIKTIVILGVFGAMACSKGQKVNSPTEHTVATGVTYQAPEDESIWAQAWDDVTAGGKAVAKAGEWTLEKAKDGAISVGRATKRVAGKTGEEISDAAIHTQIKTRMAANKKVDADDINVDVNDGDVTLRGNVSSAREASQAIRIALDTRGVDHVTSYLTWTPSSMP